MSDGRRSSRSCRERRRHKAILVGVEGAVHGVRHGDQQEKEEKEILNMRKKMVMVMVIVMVKDGR